jgi:hypothetical protein
VSTLPPPTAAPNACDTQLEPGDIYFFLLNAFDDDDDDDADDLDASIGMYTFADVPADMDLYMTDGAWNGTDFVFYNDTVDGTVKVSHTSCLSVGRSDYSM